MKAKILLSVIMSVLLLAPGAFAKQARRDSRSKAFQEALNRDGFDVTIGDTTILDLPADWCAGKEGVENAMYINKTPFLHWLLPKSADDTTVDENFQLRPDEAIVLIGPTPPPVFYFGYHAFLSTRVYPDGYRHQLFATLGDAVNNATIKTIRPTPFNSPVALIFTPDQGTDARVRAALRRAGYPTAIINTVVFPASMLNLGHSETADELRIALRIGMWDDPAINSYIQQAQDTITVYRVTPRTEAEANPFPAPRLRVRGTGKTEMDLMNKLDQLRQKIIEDNSGLQYTDIPSKPNFYEGYDYIQRWIDPWGDTRDAFFVTAGYLPEFGLSQDKPTLADDEFLMVYGANHVATGKATYMSINVYASEDAKLSIGQVFHDKLSGTATRYLPGDAGKMMYAYKVSRNCGDEEKCLELSSDDCPRLTIDNSTILGLIFRMYLEPETKVGPALTEILYDRVIKFSSKTKSE